MGLEKTFAKMLISVKAAAAKWKNHFNLDLSNEETNSRNKKIQENYEQMMGILDKNELEDRNPADILVDSIVNSFENGKSKVANAFKDLIPETSNFDFVGKLGRMNQNSQIKEGMKTTKIMDFQQLNPFGAINSARNTGFKNNRESLNDKILNNQLKQQEKTNTILERAINTEGMTFA